VCVLGSGTKTCKQKAIDSAYQAVAVKNTQRNARHTQKHTHTRRR